MIDFGVDQLADQFGQDRGADDAPQRREDRAELGTFVSTDSVVPGAGQVINYNRFLYARVNPLKVTDSSCNQPAQPALWDDPSLCAGPYDIPGGGVRSWSDAPH